MDTEYKLDNLIELGLEASEFLSARLAILKQLTTMFGKGTMNCPVYVNTYHPTYIEYADMNNSFDDGSMGYVWFYDLTEEEIWFDNERNFFFAKLVLGRGRNT